MFKDKALVKSDREKLQFIRWVLFLLAAAESAGISGMSRSQLHSLLFMSFSSARFYEIKPLRQRAQRTEQGPYYRAAHLSLGYLVFSNLVIVEDFVPYPAKRRLQFDGNFRITKKGLEVCQILRGTYTGERLYKFLIDLCLGATRALSEDLLDIRDTFPLDTATVRLNQSATLDKMLLHDLTYVEALNRATKSLIIEENPGDITPTLKGLLSLGAKLSEKMFINNKDVLTAYQTILRHRVKTTQ